MLTKTLPTDARVRKDAAALISAGRRVSLVQWARHVAERQRVGLAIAYEGEPLPSDAMWMRDRPCQVAAMANRGRRLAKGTHEWPKRATGLVAVYR